MTVPAVAEWMHVSEKTVYRLVRSHQLEAFKVGTAVRIRRSAVIEYMDTARMGGAA
nr:helix-turn-helix domain-containing protein [Gordonia humi]